MNLMDVPVQDDCNIEAVVPAKKKKMKQARLPFQMLSSVDSPNSMSNKKRKLTSPSIECKSPKVIKTITKENSVTNKDMKPNSDISSTLNESTEVTEEVDMDGIHEHEISEKTEDEDVNITPKRQSTGRAKKAEKKNMGTPSALTKFLKQDKETESTENHKNCIVQEEKVDNHCNKRPNRKSKKAFTEITGSPMKASTEIIGSPKTASREITNSPNKEEKKSVRISVDDPSCHTSDSDIAILSSDDEDKPETKKSSLNVKEDTKTSSPSTPKTPKLDQNLEKKLKKLTPKQQEKKLESAKKKEERERLRVEKEKKLEEERENKRREKEEKRKEKEEKEKAEREQKLKEKKLKELKKQMEIEQKQKEKEAKEEERRKKEEAKEEERKRKEEEKLEAERKKQKAASKFASFFVAEKQETKSTEEESVIEAKNFMPFEVKADMKIAPVSRRVLNSEEKSALDERFHTSYMEKSQLYLSEIKTKKVIPRKSGKTWPLEAKDDVILIDDENDGSCDIVEQPVVVEKHRAKLLQFTENRRPPYWGTWRKRSSSINPRKPFSVDAKWFNYEVDSDDEWEEEEPGESLHGSDDEKDEENPEDNEYDVDNEFMVPHGYLSDEEARPDEEDNEDMSPETQKFKLKVLGEQFECERNAKTSKLKPKIIGCVWQGADNKFSESVPAKTVEFLSARRAWVRQIPVILPSTAENESNVPGESTTPAQQQATTTSKKSRVPEKALPDLIRLIHGNTHGRGFLVKEFMTYWSKKHKVGENQLSKASLSQKIREIGRWMACPEEGPMHLKACWYVTEEVRKEYLPEGEELTLPNRWSYILTPKRKSEVIDLPDKAEKEEKVDKEKKSVPLITQFTKKITQEEMKKQLSAVPATSGSARPTQQKAPKRATLISVARGEQFSKSSRESLFKSSVPTDKETSKGTSGKDDEDSNDDVMIVECVSNGQVNTQQAEKSTKDKDRDARLEATQSTKIKGEEGSHETPNAGKHKPNDTNSTSGNDDASAGSTKGESNTSMDIDEPKSKE